MRAQVLDPNDPGLYRNQRGRMGSDPLMVQDTKNGRYLITSGLGPASNEYIPQSWRAIFNPASASFSLLFLFAVLFLVHANAGASVAAKLSGGVRK